MTMPENSYINLFREDFLNRKKSNPRYSIRSYAKHLGLTPAYISMIFRGQRHLSQQTAITISKKLKWPSDKQKYFINLLEFENSKSTESKEVARQNIIKLESENIEFNSLHVDSFEVISSWYYSAIITLLTILKTKATIPIIAKRLKLNQVEVENAMLRLKRLGIVKNERKSWIGLYDYLRLKSIPSDAVRNYHKQLLSKAATALDEQHFEERDFSNMTITVDKSQLKAAKKKIVDFHYEMAKLLEGREPTEVYQLSVQLFSLTDNSKT